MIVHVKENSHSGYTLKDYSILLFLINLLRGGRKSVFLIEKAECSAILKRLSKNQKFYKNGGYPF